MRAGHRESALSSPQAAWRLILAALLIGAAVIAQTLLQREGLEFTGAALVGIAGLLGGWLLNAHAQVTGLPLTMTAIMALVVFVAGFMDTANAAASGGTVFMALLVSVVARSWGVGLTALAILAGAELLAVAL